MSNITSYGKTSKVKKVLFNTVILYIKIVLNMLISLITVPLVLRALGESDYGLYNLVAGIITMLSFLNASMAISTQRYCSVAIGEGNVEKLNKVYNVSIVLHFFIALVVVLIFEVFVFFAFDSFLNIPDGRMGVAKLIYQFLVVSTFFTIMSVPFNAVMNAKEDMLAFSIIGIAEALLKLLIASLIVFSPIDRLTTYGLGLALLSILITIVNRIYVRYKYKEFELNIKKYYSKDTLKDMGGFAGWNTFGAVAMIGRNQGIAIIMNMFYGTVVNAAYGIANQVNGVLNYFSSTFQKALNPQLMQSEGENDRDRLIRISIISSKLSVLVLAMIAVPLIIEMPYILKLWLKEVPDYTLNFCRLILILSVIYQYSMGLMSSIQAVGKIKNYFLVISALVLLNLPISYYLMHIGLPPYYSLVVFIIVELASFIFRLVYANKYVGIKTILFVKTVILPSLGCIVLPLFVVVPITVIWTPSLLRIIVTFALYGCVYVSLAWLLAIPKQQKVMIKNNYLNKLIKK